MSPTPPFPSPYGFVPVSKHVWFPPWAHVPAQDVPFEDGYCGAIKLSIIAETRIFVRGDGASFFSAPDGSYALPGSGVRGAIRNVIEIASYGKLSRVNDHRFGVRDLQNNALYGRHMAAVNAGWLVRRDGGSGLEDGVVADIEVCDFYKVEYDALLAPYATELGKGGFDPNKRAIAPERYRAWGDTSGDHTTRCAKAEIQQDRAHSPLLPSLFGRVTSLGTGDTEGTLIFTGQPMGRRSGEARKKHNDFLFVDRRKEKIAVPAHVLHDFHFIHSNRGQQGRSVTVDRPNPEWDFWKHKYEAGEPVPVFFLLEEARNEALPRLRAMGLAMMFRLAYRYTTGHAQKNSQPPHDDARPDLAELMFGATPSSRHRLPTAGPRSRKGRVNFGLFRALGAVEPEQERSVVLGAPKPSFYPAYLEQGPKDAPPGQKPHDKHSYVTYMDEDVRLRGWKRYRPQEPVEQTPPRRPGGGEIDASGVATPLAALPAGTRFTGWVHIHNLRLQELGALLWALTWGGDSGCRHLIGMGRPLGYGRVRFEIETVDLRCNSDWDKNVDLSMLEPKPMDAFETAMESFAKEAAIPGGWRESHAIQELLALARPLPSGSREAQYPSIGNGPQDKDFARIKRNGLALAPLSWTQQAAPPRPWTVVPATSKSKPNAAPAASKITVPPKLLTALVPGARVEVTAIETTRKKKWRVRLLDGSGEGLVHRGLPPTGIAPGAKVHAVFVSGGNPMDLSFEWPA